MDLGLVFVWLIAWPPISQSVNKQTVPGIPSSSTRPNIAIKEHFENVSNIFYVSKCPIVVLGQTALVLADKL